MHLEPDKISDDDYDEMTAAGQCDGDIFDEDEDEDECMR